MAAGNSGVPCSATCSSNSAGKSERAMSTSAEGSFGERTILVGTAVSFLRVRADGTTGRAPRAITPPRPRERPAPGPRLCEEAERRLRGPEARKEGCRRRAEMARGDLGEQGAEVRRHGEVAALEELVSGEARPATVHAAAAHIAAEHQHRGRVAVVGAPVAVLGDGAAELRPREHDDVRHLASEVLGEGRERCPELAEAKRELPTLGALADVSVPALHVGERDLEADVRLDELGDLAQRLTELAARVVGTVRRRDA